MINYTLNLSSIPLDPRDTSTQVPNFTANIADLDAPPRSLAGKQLTLTDWTGNPTTATVSGVNSSSPSTAAADGVTLFDKINTVQTTYPLVNTTIENVLRHWCAMAGVPTYRLPERLLHCIDMGRDGNGRYGYWADGVDRWFNTLGWQYTAPSSNFTVFNPSKSAVAQPLAVDASHSLLLSAQFKNSRLYSTVYLDNPTPALGTAQGGYKLSVKRSRGVWMVTADNYAPNGTPTTSTTLLTANYSIAGNGSSNPFVFVLLKANAATPANWDITMRIMEDGATQSTPSFNPVITDFTAANVTPPAPLGAPKSIGLGYDASAPTSDWNFVSADTTSLVYFGPPLMFGISETAVLPTNYPLRQLRFGSAVNDSTALNGGSPMVNVPGSTENVWDKLRSFCSVYNIDVSYAAGAIIFTDRSTVQTDPVTGAFIPAYPIQKGSVTERTQQRNRARRVQVTWSQINNTATDCNNVLLYKADQVYSLNQGEYKEQIVQAGLPVKNGSSTATNPTTATFATLLQPVPVSGEPVPYPVGYGSSYTVTGNDGYIVDPAWWLANGGSVTVEPTDKAGEIKIKMQAPSVTTTRAPYRISEGVADRPALYISGSGLPVTKQTLSVYTGDATAPTDVGIVLDAPWITDQLTAYNAAFKLACFFSGAQSSISFQVSKTALKTEQTYTGGTLTQYPNIEGIDASGNAPYEPVPMNQSFYYDGAYFRTKSLTLTPDGLNVTETEMNNTIGVINGEFAAGKTVADWNRQYGNMTIREFNLIPLSPPATEFLGSTTFPG